MAEGPNAMRVPPREPLVPLTSLAWLVLVPGDPAAARAFTEAETEEAHRYAANKGGTCDALR